MISTFGSVVLIDVTGRTASVLERFTDGEAETQTQQQLEGIQQSVYLYHTTVVTGKQQVEFDWVKVLHPTQHKIGDVPQANLLAWYGKN